MKKPPEKALRMQLIYRRMVRGGKYRVKDLVEMTGRENAGATMNAMWKQGYLRREQAYGGEVLYSR